MTTETFDPLAAASDRFRIVGTIPVDACPVCGGGTTGRVWQLPQTRLKVEAKLAAPGAPNDGLYLHYLPMLTVPQDIFCFDLCADCDTIFQNPRSDDHAVYVTDSSKVASYRTSGTKDFEGSARAYRKMLPPGTKRVVDAACGAGQVLAILKRDEPELELTGLELSRPGVDFINGELGIRAVAVDLDLDDLSAHVPDGSADFVIFQESFEHVRSPALVLGKLMRMLRPGGRLHFTAQRYGFDSELQIRVGEPIYINEKTLDFVVSSVGARVLEVGKDIKMRVLLEKPASGDRPSRPDDSVGEAQAPAAVRASGESSEDLLNRILVPALAKRGRVLGDSFAGIPEKIRQRIDAGYIVSRADTDLAMWIAAQPKWRKVEAIGAGVGSMAFLLALCGLAVRAIESDERRAFTAKIMQKRLTEALGGDIPCTIIHGLFPLHPPNPEASSTLALMLRPISGSSEAFARTIYALRAYGSIVVDVSRFGDSEWTGTARRLATGVFAQSGFGNATEIGGEDGEARFMQFSR